MNQPKLLHFAAASLLFLTAHAFAQGGPGGPGGPRPDGKPPGPPPEAVAACAGKAVGSQVSFTGRRGDTVTGSCEKIGDVLAARPAGRPPQGPPPAK